MWNQTEQWRHQLLFNSFIYSDLIYIHITKHNENLQSTTTHSRVDLRVYKYHVFSLLAKTEKQQRSWNIQNWHLLQMSLKKSSIMKPYVVKFWFLLLYLSSLNSWIFRGLVLSWRTGAGSPCLALSNTSISFL